MKFEIFAETCARLEATTKRLEMFDILADLFRKADKEEAKQLCYLLQGQLLPAYEALDIGMGEKFVEQSVAIAVGCSKEEVHKLYKKTGDLGIAAEELMKKKAPKKELSLGEVYDTLMSIARQTGAGSQERKIKLFAELLSAASPLSVRYITRLPIGKLQLGVGDSTILEALSIAREGDRSFKEPLERAYNLCSDLGLVAERYWEGKKKIEEFEITPFRPIRPALAEREKTAEAIIKRLGKCAAEYKYDGLRLSIHKVKDKIEIFSRRLEKMTHMFPEIIDAVKENVKAKSIIFEGEALAYDETTGEFQPFQVTIQRKRKYGVEEMAKKMPLHLFCFDLLYLNGEDFTRKPYIERRRTLERVIMSGPNISMAEVLITDDAEEMKKYLAQGIERGMEGLVVKDLSAPYVAGARKFAWIKLKRSYRKELADTVDAVIVGYLKGRGARAKFEFGALLCAVYDEKTDEFKTVAKVGSGFTEEQMEQMGRELEKIEVPKKPARVDALIEPDVWVIPKYVITIAADEITESPLHTCGRTKETGYALRFPRMVSEGFRADKRPEDATTVKEILRMYALQKTVKLE